MRDDKKVFLFCSLVASKRKKERKAQRKNPQFFHASLFWLSSGQWPSLRRLAFYKGV